MKRKKFKQFLSFSLVFLTTLFNTTYLPKAVENQTISFAYPNFNNAVTNGLINLVGNASVTSSDLVLTPSLFNQAGGAFFNQKVSVASDKSFSTYFQFTISESKVSNNGYIQQNSGLGADGLVFVINNNQSSLGGLGYGIGYEGIPNSVGIEFDTYINSGYPVYDPNGDHVGINFNGSPNSVATAVNPGGVSLESGNPVHAWVDYNGATNLIEVRINSTNVRPQNATLSYNVNLSTKLNSTDVYVGFTSGTGGAASRHAIKSWYFDSKYNPIDVKNTPYTFAPTSITGSATPASNTKSTTATFIVKNVDGTPAFGTNVSFSTNIGTLSTTNAVTDANGKVSVSLTGANQTGNAVIKAVADGGIYTTVTVPNLLDSVAPSNQNSVLVSDKTVTGGRPISIINSGYSGNTIWLAPEGTSVFSESDTMTKTSGISTTINAPNTQGVYKLYVIDAAGNVSLPSSASITVDNTKPNISGVEDGKSYYTYRLPTYSDDFGVIANANYTKDNSAPTNLQPGTLLTEPGQYSVTVSDTAGNTQTINFEIKPIPMSIDVLYTPGFKKLIEDIRYEFDNNNDLSEPGKTKTDNDIKDLEDKYSTLDNEVKTIINDVNSIPKSHDDLPSQKDIILKELYEISILTPEQRTALEDQNNLLLALLEEIKSHENTVLPSDKVVTGGKTVDIVSSENSKNTIWLAPEGTSVFNESTTMTKTSGTSTTINAPTAQGVYKLYVIDENGKVSSPSSASVTVDNTLPEIYSAENGKHYYTGRFLTYSDAFGKIAKATYTKDSGSALTLKNGALLTDPGHYSVTLTDFAGNIKTIAFDIKELPEVSDILYNNESKNLIDEIKKDLTNNESLTEPYKTEITNYVKSLEDRYAQLDSEIKAITDDINSIPLSEDVLLNQKDKILQQLDRISSLTKEQQEALSAQKKLLLSMLDKINNSNTNNLPKTGSLVSLDLLATLGSITLLAGILLVFRKRRDLKNN
jgi:hypothetical protein